MGMRKGIFRYGIYIIFAFTTLAAVWVSAAGEPDITAATIGTKQLLKASEVTVIKDDLAADRAIVIVGTAEGGGPQVERVEVSLDGGQTWKAAEGRARWQYRFSPLPNYVYLLTFRVTNAAGAVADQKRFGITRLTYLPITLTELIQQRADELARAYMSKDMERYMRLISREYQSMPAGVFRLRRSIENDFRSLNNINLRFTVNQVYDLKGTIMADIHWRLTHAARFEPKEGIVEIHFDSADQLKIIVQRKDLYFGSAVIGNNATITVACTVLLANCNCTVNDLDEIGANFVTVRLRWVQMGSVLFDGNMTLTETPPRSGTFTGTRSMTVAGGDIVTGTYIDEITADWRRNIRRSFTHTVP